MRYPVKSARGVYYDLSVSPYEFISSCGVIFKFQSCKKLEIFKREREKRLGHIEKSLQKLNELTGSSNTLSSELVFAVEDTLYKSIQK